jgi:hypothetical protein
MALDRVGLRMIAGHIQTEHILCLGYPDITATEEEVKDILGVAPRTFTDHGKDHKIGHRLAETVDTLKLAGAEGVDCVDVEPTRGIERMVDLNVRQTWPREYGLVINPGTLEHCFDVATAWFNAWRALELGGVVLHVAPMTMMNHGFWNFCPTVMADFAEANGGEVMQTFARDRDWNDVPVEMVKRFRAPEESVLYALVRKLNPKPETMPTQWRYRQ